ncbi:hypothetical protein WL44_21725 [Burkholderia ubonensis]|nr:hypothetical protein WL44_21725 [Burkholderia ubonensis]
MRHMHEPMTTAGAPHDADPAECEDVTLLPLAITQVDATYGCAAGLTPDGRWLRPEPVYLADVAGDAPRYAYGRPVHCRLAPSRGADRRPEDRERVAWLPAAQAVGDWDASRLEAWLSSHCDASVAAGFAGARSAALIEATPERIELLRTTRQRHLVKLAFRDAAGESHAWIVPDLAFAQAVTAILRDAPDSAARADRLVECLGATRMFLAIVLTKPLGHGRGVIRGCQPLVSGVHTFPPYRDGFAALSGESAAPAAFENRSTLEVK